MDIEKAISVLRAHNKWRRGGGGDRDPLEIGKAIDVLCDAAASSLGEFWLTTKDATCELCPRPINGADCDSAAWCVLSGNCGCGHEMKSMLCASDEGE